MFRSAYRDSINIYWKPFPLCVEPSTPDNNKEASEPHSHHAVRQRCLSALAAVSIQPSVVQETTPVLLEVLSSAHTGSLSGRMFSSNKPFFSYLIGEGFQTPLGSCLEVFNFKNFKFSRSSFVLTFVKCNITFATDGCFCVVAQEFSHFRFSHFHFCLFCLLIAGRACFSVEEVELACSCLQRIAEQVEDGEETGRCFHDVIIPRLLSLALQAALQGEQPRPRRVIQSQRLL